MDELYVILFNIAKQAFEEKNHLKEEKYRLDFVVWLLPRHGMGVGFKDSSCIYLSDLETAKTCKTLIDKMIKDQKRCDDLNKIEIGEQEKKFWERYIGSSKFQIWWEVGDIYKVKEEKVG